MGGGGSSGGKGDDLGQPGLNGDGPGGMEGTSGAMAGAAAQGNSYITWKVGGNRRGPLMPGP